MDFNKFKTAVAAQFERMSKHDLFRVNVSKDELWETYLSSFPEGSNPIYRERTEYDCNCCKQFIRAVGSVVAIIDNKLVSIWDVQIDEPNFQIVTDALAKLVYSKPISNIFLHTEKTAGTDKSFEQALEGVKTWQHFFVNIPKKFVEGKHNIGPKLGETQASHDVLLRSLTEITDDAVDTVLELISQNSLYRGEEHKYAVTEFKKVKAAYKKNSNRDTFVWANISTLQPSVCRIRNTAIGTLLVDLSAGVEMEVAVKSFESKVAPANYKRPTALVTKSMIEAAKKKIEELGLTSALERRYAKLNDITVNNILFADRNAKTAMKGDVFSELATKVSEKPKMGKVEEVSIEKFVTDILPKADSVEVMFENKHAGNLVSLVAPVDPTAGELFKWVNGFSWSYNGDFADSIKERVKAAGGTVEGDLCCRLAWYNTDDLDFHMVEPGRHTIYFGNRRAMSPCGGMLDVDANGADGMRTDPCENIFYSNRRSMKSGTYQLLVHQYNKRNSADVGFEVEIEVDGQTLNFVYDKSVSSNAKIAVANIKYDAKTCKFEVEPLLPSTQATKNIWGIPTQTFHKVNVLMLSPNYWDGSSVGNKHYFFMLDGCKNDGSARGFFNEFLKSELDAHRKVIEMVGSKMKTEESENQLSGLGFSSTQRNNIYVRVSGSFTRVVKVNF